MTVVRRARWLALVVLVSSAVLGTSGCSSGSQASSGVSGTSNSPTAERDPSGVRIPLGQVARVPVPADAVLVIVVPDAWGEAAATLQCTATDTSVGERLTLHPPQGAPAARTDPGWRPLWMIPAGPTAVLEVGCTDPESAVPAGHGNEIRVEPRGVMPTAGPNTPVNVGQDSDGRDVSLSPNQRLIVSLRANPSTGFGWQLQQLDQNIVKQTGDADYRGDANEGQLVGVGGASVWTFTAAAPGTTTLMLTYQRSWEPGIQPAQRFSLTVHVV
ncbi:putative secreted protein [Nocardia sp. GAS34]|uniref:protease inhibitor I42 family protein n=1 Tax=unclassified Nocardia TaxID=2637762 RepID=UPI003D1B8F04